MGKPQLTKLSNYQNYQIAIKVKTPAFPFPLYFPRKKKQRKNFSQIGDGLLNGFAQTRICLSTEPVTISSLETVTTLTASLWALTDATQWRSEAETE